MDVTANGSRAWAPNSGVMPQVFSQAKTIQDDEKGSEEEMLEDI